MRILMMLTAGRGDRPSRHLGLNQVVEPYYLLHDAGAEVVVASVLGGHPPFHGSRSNRRVQSRFSAGSTTTIGLAMRSATP